MIVVFEFPTGPEVHANIDMTPRKGDWVTNDEREYHVRAIHWYVSKGNAIEARVICK